MGRRQNVLVLAGIAAFVIGMALVFVVLRDDDSAGSNTGGSDTVDVLVAKEDIAAGTKGDDALNKVQVKRVSLNNRQGDALTAPSELSNRLFNATFKAGEQIRDLGLTTRSLVTQVTPPEGKEAVSVTMPYVAGGAGYIAAGDLINVYQVIPGPVKDLEGVALDYSTPRTDLLLTNVSVLAVSYQAGPLGSTSAAASTANSNAVSRTETASPASITVVLALDTLDAEKVIFGSTANANYLYLTRLNDADPNPPSGPTSGQDYPTHYTEEANDAYNRQSPK